VNERERQRLIDRYLARLDRELADVPREARRELVEDVRGHIEEAWVASPERDQVALERILERLGTPEALAREERERLGLGAPSVAQGLGFMGWAAIVLTALLVPVGLILAWLSSHWRTRDKAIATAIVLAGLALVAATSFPSRAAYMRTAVTVQVAEAIPAPAAAGQAPVSTAEVNSGALAPVALVLVGLWGAPLLAAAYLALRARTAVRRPLALLPVALAALAFLALTLAILAPLVPRNTITTGQPAPAVVHTLQAP
jgi:uncharacterized membrane protein